MLERARELLDLADLGDDLCVADYGPKTVGFAVKGHGSFAHLRFIHGKENGDVALAWLMALAPQLVKEGERLRRIVQDSAALAEKLMFETSRPPKVGELGGPLLTEALDELNRITDGGDFAADQEDPPIRIIPITPGDPPEAEPQGGDVVEQ